MGEKNIDRAGGDQVGGNRVDSLREMDFVILRT